MKHDNIKTASQALAELTVKQAASADWLAPLAGAGIGGAAGYLSAPEKIDEDGKPKHNRLQSAMLGAAGGAAIGFGGRQLYKHWAGSKPVTMMDALRKTGFQPRDGETSQEALDRYLGESNSPLTTTAAVTGAGVAGAKYKSVFGQNSSAVRNARIAAIKEEVGKPKGTPKPGVPMPPAKTYASHLGVSEGYMKPTPLLKIKATFGSKPAKKILAAIKARQDLLKGGGLEVAALEAAANRVPVSTWRGSLARGGIAAILAGAVANLLTERNRAARLSSVRDNLK